MLPSVGQGTEGLSKPCPVGRWMSGPRSGVYRTIPWTTDDDPFVVGNGLREQRRIENGGTGTLVDPQTEELATGYTGVE